MRRAGPAIAFGLALVASSTVVTAPASAEVLSVRDATSDVVREPRACPGTGCAPPRHSLDKPGADITRFDADYRTNLVLGTEVRGVARRVYFVWLIRAAGDDYLAAVIRRRGEVTVRFLDNDGDAVQCDGLAGDLDSQSRVASATVPAACFGAPAHVRVGTQVAVVRGKYHVFFDDALRERYDPRRAPGPKLSERLDRLV